MTASRTFTVHNMHTMQSMVREKFYALILFFTTEKIYSISEILRPWQFLPSAEISNPALQTQWKLPSVFTQRPLLQMRPLATHSSRSERNKQTAEWTYTYTISHKCGCVWVCEKPRHSVLVEVVWNPGGHWQMYDPWVLTHSPCAQGFLSHSSSSGKEADKIFFTFLYHQLHSQEALLTPSDTYRYTLLVYPAWSPCCTHSDSYSPARGYICHSSRGYGSPGTCWWHSEFGYRTNLRRSFA